MQTGLSGFLIMVTLSAACGSDAGGPGGGDSGTGGDDAGATVDGGYVGPLDPLAQPRAVSEGRFATSQVCSSCHANATGATAMRDEVGNGIGQFDLWQSTMMANATRDPLWRAVVSAEVATIPSRKKEIEATCMTCHSPMAATEARLNGEEPVALSLVYQDTNRSQLALDGVSCTMCHQIQDTNLGTSDSFSGNYQIGDSRQIFGPHASPFAMPMQRHTNYTPVQGNQMTRSALCGSCHTLHTTAMLPDGTITGDVLPEQTPYLEWRNSAYTTEVASPGPDAADCQTCHVPTTSEAGVAISTAIARNPEGADFGMVGPRSPYGRHIFVGGNTLIPQILRDNRDALSPLASTEAFNATIALTRDQLQNRTADIAIEGASISGGQLTATIAITNRAGHKLPSAHPSRRAWLHVVVRAAGGAVLFESGRHDGHGTLVDAGGTPLPSELTGGPLLAHTSQIDASSSPLVYETVMADSDGAITYRLLRGAKYLKDNRLLPKGWSEAAAIADIAPVGVTDADFVGGSDRVSLSVAVGASTSLTVEVRLLYQTLSARYANELFAVDTPEVQAFRTMYQAADRTPETLAQSQVNVSAVAP